jgi:hypothetical protein
MIHTSGQPRKCTNADEENNKCGRVEIALLLKGVGRQAINAVPLTAVDAEFFEKTWAEDDCCTEGVREG